MAIYTEAILERTSRKEIELSVRKRLESLKPSSGYKYLTSLPWKGIYSTNYDVLLEEAYKKQNFLRLVKINKYNQYDTLANHEIPFFKIHGCVLDVYDPEKPLVISFSDLIRNRALKKDLMRRLTNDLVETVLFVGYSFRDQVITDLLTELQSSNLWDSISEKYAVLHRPFPEDKVKFKTYGINVIEGDFDTFFREVATEFDQDALAKMKVLRKTLIVEFGKKALDFEPRTKDALDTYFEYFIPNEYYPNDPLYFYRGGKPGWGNIINNLDVPRTLKILDCNSKVFDNSVNLDYFVELIEKIVFDESPAFTSIKLNGPAAVGKTTLIYRLCYELMNKGVLALIYKDVGQHRQGLLSEIFKINNETPYVIVVDSAASAGLQINRMYTEAVEKGLPIIFILATRENDWNIFLDGHVKRRLNKFNYILSLEDKINDLQSKLLVKNLVKTGVINVGPERTEKDLIKLYQESNHLMVSLMESIDNNKFDLAISSEYDSLSDVGRKAYGLISLVSGYGLSFKWELLQRTLNRLYKVDWREFVENIVLGEGKDVIKEEGTEPNFYYTCRHSVIANRITLMHYKDIREEELNGIKAIIKSVNKGTSEEFFIGKFVNLLIKHFETDGYSFDEILDILNTAIVSLSDQSFLLHIKGQYLLDNGQPDQALLCFEKNLNSDSWNKMYSLHSLGMSHMALAKNQNIDSGRRQLELKYAKDTFYSGLMTYRDNVFFYRSLFQVISIKFSDGNVSHQDVDLAKKVLEYAEQYIVDETEEIQDLRVYLLQFEEMFEKASLGNSVNP